MASCAPKGALRMSQDDVRAEGRPQAAETLPYVPTAPIKDNTAPSHTASRDSEHRQAIAGATRNRSQALPVRPLERTILRRALAG
jgi:hypothetical protein